MLKTQNFGDKYIKHNEVEIGSIFGIHCSIHSNRIIQNKHNETYACMYYKTRKRLLNSLNKEASSESSVEANLDDKSGGELLETISSHPSPSIDHG